MILKISWDLAGNFTRFDTLRGFPLTKFDHLPFSENDYLKLKEIIKDKNSPLRRLGKSDLIDKTDSVKSKVVDAVTGATPKTIKNAVVSGAAYSTYRLWHFVNMDAKNQIINHTSRIYSKGIEAKLLMSDNYETQLFALKRMSPDNLQSS